RPYFVQGASPTRDRAAVIVRHVVRAGFYPFSHTRGRDGHVTFPTTPGVTLRIQPTSAKPAPPRLSTSTDDKRLPKGGGKRPEKNQAAEPAPAGAGSLSPPA